MTGYRKFIVMVLLVVTCAGLVASGLMTGAEFVEGLKMVGVAFMGANLFEHVGVKK